MARTAELATPIGTVTLKASATGLVGVTFGRLGAPGGPGEDPAHADPAQAILEQAAEQLQQYFAGSRTELAIPLDESVLSGGAGADSTPFRGQVLAALQQVPFGQVVTYGELAKLVGSPKAARAVGSACAHNPVPLVIPCHRVVPASFSARDVGGFLGSSELGAPESAEMPPVARKRWLLRHEGWQV